MSLRAVRSWDTRGSTSVESVVLCALVATVGMAALASWGAAGKRAIEGDGAVPGHAMPVATMATSSQAGLLSAAEELAEFTRTLPSAKSTLYHEFAGEIRGAFGKGGRGYALLPTKELFPERLGLALLQAGESSATEWGGARRLHLTRDGFTGDVSDGASWKAFHEHGRQFLHGYYTWTHRLLREALGSVMDRVRPGGDGNGRGQILRLAFDGVTRGDGWHADAALINVVLSPLGPGTVYVPEVPEEIRQHLLRVKPSHVHRFSEEHSALLDSMSQSVPAGHMLINAGMYGRGLFRDGMFTGPEPLVHRAPDFHGARATLLHPYRL